MALIWARRVLGDGPRGGCIWGADAVLHGTTATGKRSTMRIKAGDESSWLRLS